MSSLYYLSDIAYAHLSFLAKRQRFTLANNKGLARFITELSYRKFTDARPKHIREHDIEMLEAGFHPDWRNQLYLRLPRRLELPPIAVENYVKVAHEFAIMDRFYKPGALAGAVLEAIGLQYLMPDIWPLRTKRIQNRKKYEFNWI